jgi:hypothetical protein
MLDEGKLEDKEIFCLLLNFPGKIRRQKRTSLPLIGELYLIENRRHNYGQCLTTPSRTHTNDHYLPMCFVNPLIK